VELQARYDEFQSAGIHVALITYDSEDDQAKFARKHEIQFPLLSDVDVESVSALGILNTDHTPGEFEYGIPHPGFYVLDRRGDIVAKSFLERYQQRLSTSGMLKLADQSL
jgi:peroxiredoxin